MSLKVILQYNKLVKQICIHAFYEEVKLITHGTSKETISRIKQRKKTISYYHFVMGHLNEDIVLSLYL